MNSADPISTIHRSRDVLLKFDFPPVLQKSAGPSQYPLNIISRLKMMMLHRQVLDNHLQQRTMPSTRSNPAFLPSIPLTQASSLSRTPIPLRSIRRSPQKTSVARRPYVTATADIHDSWRIYSKPGNSCVLCAGNGSTKCLYCFGEGVIRVGPEAARDTVDCPHCEGSGMETCIRCDGSGIRPDTRIDEDGAVVRNLKNEEVCLLPLAEYPPAPASTTTDNQRETASNGVAAS